MARKLNKSIFLSIFFILAISVVSATVPYEDLTLEWKGVSKFVNHDYPSANFENEVNYIYIYSSLQDGKISQKSADNGFEEIIDIESREIVSEGEYNGAKTSHWIDINSKVGEKIKIADSSFFVKSISEKIYLKDFGNVECIKLENKVIKDKVIGEEGESTKNIVNTRTIWYDKKTGLKLKDKTILSYDHIFEYEYLDTTTMKKEEIKEYELRENNIDNDKDGLTDLEELLTYETNPLEADSDFDGLEDKEEINLKLNPLNENTDGDFWIDGKDSNPLSKTAPLIYYILGLILTGGLTGGFFWFKSSNNNKK